MEVMTIARQFFFTGLLFFGALPLYSESASMMDFFQLESSVQEITPFPRQIQIRGFLYLKDSTLILAAEPNLKSCCVGSEVKRHAQLLVFGDEIIAEFNSASPVKLKGMLTQHPDHTFLYHLEEATLIPEEPRSYMTVLVVGGILAMASILLLIRRKG